MLKSFVSHMYGWLGVAFQVYLFDLVSLEQSSLYLT